MSVPVCIEKLVQPPSNDQRQVGVAGLLAGGGDHRVRLAAMMRLVIEKMGNQNAARCAHLASDRYAEPRLIVLQPTVGDACRPVGDAGVGLRSGPAQLV